MHISLREKPHHYTVGKANAFIKTTCINPKPMKKLLFLVFMLISLHVMAQQGAITFEKTTHDFGEIGEQGGKVNYKFVFTNTGQGPLIISQVNASCGCTTPAWSKEPIAPGEQGFIMAEYDPRNRPGNFQKSLSVVSNAPQPTNVLYIKGTVVEGELARAESPAPAAIPVSTAPVNKEYVRYFKYNDKDIVRQDKEFTQFVEQLAPLAKQGQTIKIAIEASASHVPTERFKKNEALSAQRARQARELLIKAFAAQGVNSNQLEFEPEKAIVQGPAYKKDFDQNQQVYEKYQYVKSTAR
jgi:hypothetical protein